MFDKYNIPIWGWVLSKFTKEQLEMSDVDLNEAFEEITLKYRELYTNLQIQEKVLIETGQVYRCKEIFGGYREGELFFVHSTDIEDDGVLVVSDCGVKGLDSQDIMVEMEFTPLELFTYFERVNPELEEQYWLELDMLFAEENYGR